MKKLSRLTLTCALSVALLSGCATTTLLEKDSGGTYTTTKKNRTGQ